MLQRAMPLGAQQFLLLATLAGVVGCERPAEVGSGSAPGRARPTVVSLVPAATDLLLGMGAGTHLAGVSNWDSPRLETADLPRVGDYRSVDWEKIAQIRPDVMIVQFAPDKLPPGLTQRAKDLGIKLVNVKINRLADVFSTMTELGAATDKPAEAREARTRLQMQLDTVSGQVPSGPPVRTLISRSESGLSVVGGGNFMDDVLEAAGGKNVIETGENSYPVIDREQLAALAPDVVLHVLPDASPQQVQQARDFWKSMPQLPAVANDRVYYLTDSYLLLPGYSVGKMAELFAQKLHPLKSSKDKL
jgi:ABC-type Fe3+-hydroxamate transport system substrate-binding protein